MNALAPGMLLVATAALTDPNFADTVVLLLDVGDDGAVGVVLNRPTGVAVDDVLDGWGSVVAEPVVLFHGGPVGLEGALAVAQVPLTGDAAAGAGLRPISPGLALVDLDQSCEALAGRVTALRIFAGYAGWSAGQLEDEVEQGAWYVVSSRAGDLAREDTSGLARDVLRRQPGELAWVATRPVDPGLN
ncbi:YqgE/AlgH family protein [Nocardioides acrostichi]|uniref:YqgE/AlgH family protein n=1 Tax=Nocardioides acrostichi TaxID=2784339 RepID=A0A930Y4D3_9ACTN|nr:YqgE/AlgH family protein [Nocardioides acrostichi]MBF4160070.1 YqgE/AlgH family protein [Nocardioides acrostichi]